MNKKWERLIADPFSPSEKKNSKIWLLSINFEKETKIYKILFFENFRTGFL